VSQDSATVSDLRIGPLAAGDIPEIAAAFAAIGWNKPVAQYERYLEEQARRERDVLVARCANTFAGYLTIVWLSTYPPFLEAGIPEIVDLNVLPHRRRRGIASRLLDVAERRIGERSPIAGIGVGMDRDYGAAQRLYVKRGYVPDGRGLTHQRRPLAWGETITVDDDLVLFFTRSLGA
jgi:GNAT superfamily N-acetyltransferase